MPRRNAPFVFVVACVQALGHPFFAHCALVVQRCDDSRNATQLFRLSRSVDALTGSRAIQLFSNPAQCWKMVVPPLGNGGVELDDCIGDGLIGGGGLGGLGGDPGALGDLGDLDNLGKLGVVDLGDLGELSGAPAVVQARWSQLSRSRRERAAGEANAGTVGTGATDAGTHRAVDGDGLVEASELFGLATGVLGRSYAISGPLLNWLLMRTDSIPFRLISRLEGPLMCVGVPHFDLNRPSPIEIVACSSQPFQKSMVDWYFKLASTSDDGNRSANLGSAVKIQVAFPANGGYTGGQGQSGGSVQFCVDAGPPPPIPPTSPPIPPPPSPPPAKVPTWGSACGDFQVVQPKTLAKGYGWGLQANMVLQPYTTTVTDCASTCCANGGCAAPCRTWQWRDKVGCGPTQQGIYTPFDDVAGFNAMVMTSDEACQDSCEAISECVYWTRFQSSGWCHLSGSLAAVHTTAPPSEAAHCGTCPPNQTLYGCWHGLNGSPGGLNASITDGGAPWLTAVVAIDPGLLTTTTRAPTRRPTAPPGPRPPSPPRPNPQPQKHNDDHGMSESAELDVVWVVLASLAVFFGLVFVNVFVLSRKRRSPGPRSETAHSNRSFDNLVGIPGTESATGARLGTEMTQGTRPSTPAVGAPDAAGAAGAVTAARPRLADETAQAAAAAAAAAADAAEVGNFWGLGVASGIPQPAEAAAGSPSPAPAEVPVELVQPRFKVITVNLCEGQSIGLGIKDTKGGLVITGVVPGGAAAGAGIETGQLLVSVNGNLVMTMRSAECMAIISSASITVTFVVVHVTGAGFESQSRSPEALEPLSKPSKRARVSPSAALTNTDLTMGQPGHAFDHPFSDLVDMSRPSAPFRELGLNFLQSAPGMQIDADAVSSPIASMLSSLPGLTPLLPPPLPVEDELNLPEGLHEFGLDMLPGILDDDNRITFERYTPDFGVPQKLPPQKRYQRFTEEEWKTNIKGAIEAGFGRFKAVGDTDHTTQLIDTALARIVTGAGKFERPPSGARKKPCFLIKRERVGSKAPFHVKVSGTRMVAQKAAFAAYNALEAHEIGTWQVEQSCLHNNTEWWCFEPSHLQRCIKDHVRPGSTKCPIPGPPHAMLTS